MHRRITISHNIVTGTKYIPSHIEMDTGTTFRGDISSRITNCAGCVQMTYEPIQYECNGTAVRDVSRPR